jgi:peptidoglycan/xylan/chitin deacetylase (PgdA/CDA1 family)
MEMIIRNFLFHRVSDDVDRFWPPMPTTLFESLVKYIHKRFHVVELEDYLLNARHEKLKKTPATILFDDGYKDNIEYAVPILDKYKCPASFYVATGCIDNNIPTWTYIVDHSFQNTRAEELTLDLDFVPEALKQNEFASEGGRLEIGGKLKPWMKNLSNHERQQVLARLQAAFADVEVPSNKMMNWRELQQMHNAGFAIGSHSVSHPLLASIKNEDELLFEVGESAKRIETELGVFPVTISYPIGSYDERVIALSKQVGYKIGLAVEQRFYNSGKDDRFAIPRVELHNEPMWKCRLRISGIYNWLRDKIPS